MNGSEYYDPREEWPQPADDPATLPPAEPPEQAPPKPKKKRARKKMTESLTGLTAASLAVVMLATAIFDDKKGPSGSPGLQPNPRPGEVCSVCHDPECLYFYDGLPGIVLTGKVIDSGDGLYVPYDLYQMNGLTDMYTKYRADDMGIATKSLERLIFRLHRDAFEKYWTGMPVDFMPYRQSTLWGSNPPDDRTGVMFTITDDKSEEYMGFLLAFLVYAPNGLPGFDPNLPNEVFPHKLPQQVQPEFRAIDVPGFPDAQIHLYSDFGSDYLDAVEQYCTVDVVPALTTQQLGKTMNFRETTDWFRSYTDIQVSGSIHREAIMDGKEEYPRVFYSEYSFVQYCTQSETFPGEMSIYKLPDVPGQDWMVLMERYENLNSTAPKSSHEVYFPLLHLDPLTVNGITYDCWMPYKAEEVGGNWWRPKFLFIPKQEPTVMLTYDISMLSSEELTAISQDSTKYFENDMPYLFDRLNQISLR